VNKNCLLEDPNCKRNCANCGWNPKEAERRKKEFVKNGLTLCKDGLHRIVIKREG
jgi:hypothetical protein